MLGIFLIGSGFSLLFAGQIISIVAKTAVYNYVSMITMFNTTIILSIMATILYITGILLLALNSKNAESEGLTADTAVRLQVTLLVMGSLIACFLILIINALIEVPVLY